MTTKKNHIDPEKIKLDHIEEVLVNLEEFERKPELNPSVDIKIAHMSAHNITEKKFLLGLEIVISSSDLEDKVEFKFRYNFHFSIDNFEEMYELNENEEPIFQKLFVATLTGISYSTLRGIIFEKTKSNNLWGSLTLPVVNPALLLDSWIEKE